MTDEKVLENRLRRIAERRGMRLEKSRRRDPKAIDHGGFMLIDAVTSAPIAGADPPYSATLDDVADCLGLDVADARPVGKFYELDCIYRAEHFTSVVAKTILDQVEHARYPTQPPGGRLKRATALAAAKILHVLHSGHRPAEGRLHLSAADFADPVMPD